MTRLSAFVVSVVACTWVTVACGGGARGGLGSGGSDGTGATGSGGAAAGGAGSGGAASGGSATGGSGGDNDGLGGATNQGDLPGSLGPTLRGLVFSNQSEAYGETGTVYGGAGPTYFFSADRGVFFLYFPASGEGDGLTFQEGYDVTLPSGEAAEYDVTTHGPQTASAWGLSADAHFVDIEISDGRGMAPGTSLVATEIRLVSVSEISMDPVAVLTDARQRYDAFFAARSAAIDQLLIDAQAAHPAPTGATISESEWLEVEPHWRDSIQSLTVYFNLQRLWSWQLTQTGPGGQPSTLSHTSLLRYTVLCAYDSAGTLAGSSDVDPTVD